MWVELLWQNIDNKKTNENFFTNRLVRYFLKASVFASRFDRSSNRSVSSVISSSGGATIASCAESCEQVIPFPLSSKVLTESLAVAFMHGVHRLSSPQSFLLSTLQRFSHSRIRAWWSALHQKDFRRVYVPFWSLPSPHGQRWGDQE